MSRSRISGLTLTALAALLITGCASAAPSAEPGNNATSDSSAQTLTVGVTPIVNAASVYVGVENGQFAEQDLQVNTTIVQNTSTAIPSLLNGELDVALINSVAAITAGAKGLPIKLVSGSDRYPIEPGTDTTALVVTPSSGINELTDLSDKTVAVVGLKSGPELATRVVLENAGVSPDSVDFVELAYPDMAAAVESGRVDAAFIVDPFLAKAKAEGLESISQPFTEGLGGMSAMTWVVSQQFAEANPDVLEQFVTAIEASSEFANENPDAVRAILPEFTSLSEDAINNTVISQYDTELTQEDLQAWSDLLSEHAFIETGYDPEGLLWSK